MRLLAWQSSYHHPYFQSVNMRSTMTAKVLLCLFKDRRQGRSVLTSVTRSTALVIAFFFLAVMSPAMIRLTLLMARSSRLTVVQVSAQQSLVACRKLKMACGMLSKSRFKGAPTSGSRGKRATAKKGETIEAGEDAERREAIEGGARLLLREARCSAASSPAKSPKQVLKRRTRTTH